MITAIDRSQLSAWYQSAHDYIFSRYEYPELLCKLIAATSPRTRLSTNYKTAKKLYVTWLTTGEINYNDVWLKMHIPNIKRALFGLPLSGNKVTRFAENLIGNYHPVAIDCWICYYFGIPQTKLSTTLYLKLERQIQDHAENLGVHPCELQAHLWNIARIDAGYKPASFVDLMRKLDE